jgi:hypothetical protein
MPSVRLDLDGPVARITLNRPEVLNAGDPVWVAELTDVVARVGLRGRHCVRNSPRPCLSPSLDQQRRSTVAPSS